MVQCDMMLSTTRKTFLACAFKLRLSPTIDLSARIPTIYSWKHLQEERLYNFTHQPRNERGKKTSLFPLFYFQVLTKLNPHSRFYNVSTLIINLRSPRSSSHSLFIRHPFITLTYRPSSVINKEPKTKLVFHSTYCLSPICPSLSIYNLSVYPWSIVSSSCLLSIA